MINSINSKSEHNLDNITTNDNDFRNFLDEIDIYYYLKE